MASWHGEYIHVLEILASSPLSKGSRDFNRGEQSRAPPPSCTYEIDINHRVLHPQSTPSLRPLDPCSSVCSHDASDIHGLLSIDEIPPFFFIPRLPFISRLKFSLRVFVIKYLSVYENTSLYSDSLFIINCLIIRKRL